MDYRLLEKICERLFEHSFITMSLLNISPMNISLRIRRFLAKRSSESYCNFLRNQGVVIGEGTIVRPKKCTIDTSRPSLVKIGKNCMLNDNFTLLTHDFVCGVFLNSNRDFVNSSGAVVIGNNVRFGHNVMVLKGVTIGDNCFIGAGSIVTKDIPANSIATGSPCKVIMSLEDYYQKRLAKSEEEALEYARSIQERFHRRPVPADFWEEFIWFVSGNEIDKYPEIPIKRQLGPSYERYVNEHKAKYNSFDAFLQAAGL